MCRRRVSVFLAVLSWLALSVFSGAAHAVSVTVAFAAGSWVSEVGWQIFNTATNQVVMCEPAAGENPPETTILDLPPGNYQVNAFDSYGDGWNSGYLTVSSAGSTLFSGTLAGGGESSSCGGAGYGISIGGFNITDPAAVSLAKTVGTTPGVCAATDTITVPSGTTVYYCYTVTNTGSLTLTTHTLVDDALGTVFTDLSYTLTPGSSVNTVAAGITVPAVISATTVNNAVWTASAPGVGPATGNDSATVNVTYAVIGAVSPTDAGVVECIPSTVAPAGNSTCTASANPGYEFSYWLGDCSGTDAACDLSGIDRDMSVTANFALVATRDIPTLSPLGWVLLSILMGVAAYRRR